MNVEDGEIIEVECIPPVKIPYWTLAKIGVLALGVLYTKKRMVRIGLSIIAAYLIYGSF